MPSGNDTIAPSCITSEFDADGHSRVIRDVTDLYQRLGAAETAFNALIPQGARPGAVGPQGPSGSTGGIPATGPSGQTGVSTALTISVSGAPATLYVWGYTI